MGLFVSISRWTPEQAEAVEKRWDTILNGTAPKAVMDAWAKMKIIAQVTSPQNGFSLMVLEVTDQTWIDGTCSLPLHGGRLQPSKAIRSAAWNSGWR